MPLNPAIAVLARTPVPGRTKTRLIPLLDAEGAAEFHGALLRDTLSKVARLPATVARHVFLTPLPPSRHLSRALYRSVAEKTPVPFTTHAQHGRDFGKRLDNAFAELFRVHAPVVIIGTDSPLIPGSRFVLALRELEICEAVLGPCEDGGYYLIGLRRPVPGVLRSVRWGGRYAYRDTLRNLLGAGLSCSILEMGSDVDTPRDFACLKRELKRDPAARRLAPETWKFVKGHSALHLGF